MDSEQIVISSNSADKINSAKIEKRRICAVGTTVMRTVESSVSASQQLNPFSGWTNKFLFPPHEFSIANSMISNFHKPKFKFARWMFQIKSIEMSTYSSFHQHLQQQLPSPPAISSEIPD